MITLVQLLQEAGYDNEKILFLKDGFENGFDIGYCGPENRQSESNNIPLKVGNRTNLWNKLMKEVKHKRVAGPFKQIPFDNYIQSPIGLIPKAGSNDQTRLIFHLSYDFNKQTERSLNFYTPKELSSVKYNDLDYAVRAYLKVRASARNQTEKAYWKNGGSCGSKDNNNDDDDTVFSGKTDCQKHFQIGTFATSMLEMAGNEGSKSCNW